jgi:IS4 transposase
VEITLGNQAEDSIPARIVYIRGRSNRKKWIALLSTDMDLSEEEIIALYGKRWDIEVFFKMCKSYLKLTGEFRSSPMTRIPRTRRLSFSVHHVR